MEFDIRDLVVATASAIFTLFVSWFGSFLTTTSEKKKSSQFLKHQIDSLNTEMADLTSMVKIFSEAASNALEETIKSKKPPLVYVPSLEIPIYSEFFKIVHIHYPEIQRRNIRHFYNHISEINAITERFRSYTHSLTLESRAILDAYYLKVFCFSLEALYRNLDKDSYKDDVDFYLQKEEAGLQYQQALDSHFVKT